MACGSCAERQGKFTYVVTDGSGKKTTYGTEIEAKAAVARRGGSYKRA